MTSKKRGVNPVCLDEKYKILRYKRRPSISSLILEPIRRKQKSFGLFQHISSTRSAEKFSNVEDDLPFQLHVKNVHIDGRLSPTVTGGVLVWPVLRTCGSSMVLSIRQTGGSNVVNAQCEIWLRRHWLKCRKFSLFTDLFTVLKNLNNL
jgi:hypothetical protein